MTCNLSATSTITFCFHSLYPNLFNLKFLGHYLHGSCFGAFVRLGATVSPRYHWMPLEPLVLTNGLFPILPLIFAQLHRMVQLVVCLSTCSFGRAGRVARTPPSYTTSSYQFNTRDGR